MPPHLNRHQACIRYSVHNFIILIIISNIFISAFQQSLFPIRPPDWKMVYSIPMANPNKLWMFWFGQSVELRRLGLDFLRPHSATPLCERSFASAPATQTAASSTRMTSLEPASERSSRSCNASPKAHRETCQEKPEKPKQLYCESVFCFLLCVSGWVGIISMDVELVPFLSLFISHRGTIHVLCAMVQRSDHNTRKYLWRLRVMLVPIM